MFSLRSLRVSVRFRHGLRDCSGVVSETGSSGDDNISGQLTPGADHDTQVLSLAPELARFVTVTKVDSLTHSIKVAKEKLRNRFGDKVVMSSVNFEISLEKRCWVLKFHNSILSLLQASANFVGQNSILQVRICGEDSSPEQ